MKRPIGVTILAVFAGILALLAIAATLRWLGLFPFLGPGPGVRVFNIWNALIWGLLAWVYVWLTQMLWRVDPQAWLFMAVITVFNLTLAFVELITGNAGDYVAAAVVLNGLVLIYMMLPGTRKAFGQA